MTPDAIEPEEAVEDDAGHRREPDEPDPSDGRASIALVQERVQTGGDVDEDNRQRQPRLPPVRNQGFQVPFATAGMNLSTPRPG